jgi:putative membrane-bound dehydrogenase-like protein
MMQRTGTMRDMLAARASNGWAFQQVMVFTSLLGCLGFSIPSLPPLHAADWIVGAARQEITPEHSVRLSGYASRDLPHEGVDDGLEVRAIVFRRLMADSATEESVDPWQVLVSVDSIGVPASLTERIVARIGASHGIGRHQIAIASTHTHYAPHLIDAIPNLFTVPLNDQEILQVAAYTQLVEDRTVGAIAEAISKAVPAKLEIGQSKTDFARNRRPPLAPLPGTSDPVAGPVDHRVFLLKATSIDGRPIAVVYQYACHATTIPAERNRVSGDWPGWSARKLQEAIPGCVALPVIGCGADANPTPRGSLEISREYGERLADVVRSAILQPMEELANPSTPSFDLVALAYDRPDPKSLEPMLESDQPQQRFFARSMLDTYKRMGRLPETYPAPVHVWKFGDQLAWVFLGGEVVIDYQMRLQEELGGFAKVWVAGYCDDVFAYVASERVRREGGYEAAGSMLYYNRPGPWESGTEDYLVRRIAQQVDQLRDPNLPLEPEAALRGLTLAEGFEASLVASEPLIEDPVNVAFDARGRVWVVEMRDYPTGPEGSGRIQILEDRDGDGRMDHATLFLEGLSYPTGVFPWKDGAVVACAPEIFFARDTDGDGRADQRQTLIDGFHLANPQHRVHGFTYGLDHRLYFGAGDETRTIHLPRIDQKKLLFGGDLALEVDSGVATVEPGATQFIRGRDDFGQWFGNDNSHPIFHYCIDPKELPSGATRGGSLQHFPHQPSLAPPVFPLQRNENRFNDLFAANRYTSACSTIICRTLEMGAAMAGAGLTCEPVHQMVTRYHLVESGPTFRAVRFAEDQQSEWLRSDDPWFRPVRVENATDGTIWVVDMYRRYIEHPEWIPEDWQQRIDLRAGSARGRIYRISQTGRPPQRLEDLQAKGPAAWVAALASPNGARRDLAQQLILWNRHVDQASAISRLARSDSNPAVRLQAHATLRGLDRWTPEDQRAAIGDPDPRVVTAIVPWLPAQTTESDNLLALRDDPRVHGSPALALRLLLLELRRPDPSPNVIARLLATHAEDRWFQQASQWIDPSKVDPVLESLKADGQDPIGASLSAQRWDALFRTLLPRSSQALRIRWLESLQQSTNRPLWHYVLAGSLMQDRTSVADLPEAEKSLLAIQKDAVAFLASDGAKVDPAERDAMREVAVRLVGQGYQSPGPQKDAFEALLLQQSLNPTARIATEAMDWLVRGESRLAIPFWLERWGELRPEFRAALLARWVRQVPWHDPLLEALQSQKLSLKDLDPDALETLANSPSQPLARWVAQASSKPNPQRMTIVGQWIDQMPEQRDAGRGEAIFQRHCAACHQPGEDGRAIGPSLQALAGWNDQAWATAILDPNQSVEPKFRKTVVLSTDGAVLTGKLIDESQESIELESNDRRITVLPRDQIESMETTTQSIMPEGFEQFVSPQDLADLVAWLRREATSR